MDIPAKPIFESLIRKHGLKTILKIFADIVDETIVQREPLRWTHAVSIEAIESKLAIIKYLRHDMFDPNK